VYSQLKSIRDLKSLIFNSDSFNFLSSVILKIIDSSIQLVIIITLAFQSISFCILSKKVFKMKSTLAVIISSLFIVILKSSHFAFHLFSHSIFIFSYQGSASILKSVLILLYHSKTFKINFSSIACFIEYKSNTSQKISIVSLNGVAVKAKKLKFHSQDIFLTCSANSHH